MRTAIIGALALCVVPAGCETGAGGDLGQVLGDVLGEIGTTDPSTGELTTLENAAALRQALEIGTGRVARAVGPSAKSAEASGSVWPTR